MDAQTLAPLDDPTYEPAHPPPINGRIPDVIAKWGPRSQLRWFLRFSRQLTPRQDVASFYVESPHHTGWCCHACEGDYEDGYQGGGVKADGWCCCRDQRIQER